jgi:3D (Asp-Asp-Asp) domain-containing protein
MRKLLLILALALPASGATITAYCDSTNNMADGKRVHVGACAGPRSIPFGTKVRIERMGVYTVEDRTARRFDGRFDIWMPSRSTCIKFGKQELKVEVLR